MMHDESLLLYARAYDLVEGHTSISPLSFICLPYDTEEDDVNLITNFLENLPFRTTSVHSTTNERLEVVKDVSLLLAKTISLRVYAENPEDGYQKSDDFYLDEPLLCYEASLSTNTVNERLDLTRFPLKGVVPSKEDDDGELQFPYWAWERRNEIAADLAGERMAVDRKVLEFLRKTVKNPDAEKKPTRDCEDDCYDVSTVSVISILHRSAGILFGATELTRLEQLEPLNLETGDKLPFIPTFENGNLMNESLDEDTEAVKLFKSIQLAPLISSSPIRPPPKELHVETPLTPPLTSPNKHNIVLDKTVGTDIPPEVCGPTKKVKFSDIVEEFLIPPSLDPSEGGYDDEVITDDYLTHSAMAQLSLEVMEPGAQFFLMQLQQEQLEDSTKSEQEPKDGLRVELPIVSWKRPTPPWVLGGIHDDDLVGAIDKEVMVNWEYRKSLDIAGLCWTIGNTTVSQPGVTETIFPETEEELWKGIEDVFPVLPLETVIEDEDESFWDNGQEQDEDLECAKIQPKTDLDSLIERRRLQRPTTNHKYVAAPLLDPRSNLSSFLSLQNRSTEPHPSTTIHSSSAAPPPIPSAISCSQTDPSTVQPSIQVSSLPSDPSSTFIIAASFLANRTLYKAIRSFCPNSKFIERDFEQLSPVRIFGKQDQVPEEYTIEADIIVSPLTGIILTDLQTIRRRPLPTNLSSRGGDSIPKTCEEIRARISELSRRYENLAVGVSIDFGGSGVESVELSTTDCAILAAFIGFCEGIGNIEVTIIPGSGKSGVQELGKWVVKTMDFHSTPWKNVGLEVEITEKETMWEAFLRNSGMNSYAAQAILTKLHESECGLVDFVTIEKESRRVIFEQFVGRKSLERFEEVSDARWQYG
ncbi:hypothetical protein TWF970_000650 [Orbilia oligospora]|uniref:Uncharacterized protein n=1 Tax=Orbilia oligospora TaxID=2813651 RepID=A0A7C8VYC5_ORBOL|nr:hypothetical protein TWF970_000650 [Orbilia oligospora]